jgi:hypothetical protein
VKLIEKEKKKQTNENGKGRNEDCGVNEMRLWWFLDKRGATPLQIRPAPAVARTVGKGDGRAQRSPAQHQHSGGVGSVDR